MLLGHDLALTILFSEHFTVLLNLMFQVVVDILSKCPLNESYEIHINHLSILEAIWSWSGVKKHERKDVAKVKYLKSKVCRI